MANSENLSEVNKSDLIIKLLGLLLTQKDFNSKKQQEQISIMKKVGLRTKDIAFIFGISSQQVGVAMSRTKKARDKKGD